MTMIDLHRPAAVALSHTERQALLKAAGLEAAEIKRRREFALKHDQPEQAVMLGVELDTLNAARQKLGGVVVEESDL